MALCSVGLLFSLLYSSVLVSSEEFTSLVDNSAYVPDPEAEWHQLEHLLANGAKAKPLRPVFGQRRGPGSSPRTYQLSQSAQAVQSQQSMQSQQSVQSPLITSEPPATSPAPAPVLPEFLPIPAKKSEELKRILKPEGGPAGMLPAAVKQMLSVTAPPPPPPAPTRPQLIEVLCHIDRMYVRVRKELFSTFRAYQNLKMGSCPVNQASKDHYYLLYLLTSDCGFHKESGEDAFLYSINVRYEPNAENGIVREPSFTIPVQCRYHRVHHSFSVGYRPKLPEPIFRPLYSKPSTRIALTVMDASGNDVNIFTMGKPMCFEAELSDPKPGDRVYINECFVTSKPAPQSEPRYTVIASQGCMTDGMLAQQSKFKVIENAPRTRQRFCIAAFRFKDTLSAPTQLMYLHCDISVGRFEADQTSKACNFDLKYQRWRELYGKHSACACCPDSCSPLTPRASKTIVSSHAWKVADGSKMTRRGKPKNYFY